MRPKLTILLVTLLLPCAHLGAGDWGFQLDLVSSFVWRGIDLNPDHRPVLQPSLTYSHGDSGLAVELWSSFSSESKELHETDLIVSYQVQTPARLSLSFGYSVYGWYLADQLSGLGQRTNHEVSVTVGLPETHLSPELTVYYDFDDGDGLYAALSVSHAVAVRKTTIELSASAGYNDGQWLPEGADTGLSDVNLGVAVPFVWHGSTLTPFVTYTVVLLDDISPDNHLWYGLSVSW